MTNTTIGQILWTDLTVKDADEIRDFYQGVLGWTFEEMSMEGYADYMMIAPHHMSRPTEGPARVAGICHARGPNADLPAQWLNYFGVENIDIAREAVTRLGGKLLMQIRTYGASKFCVIEDPAGAVCALFENVEES
ncbi:MAG: VOC family protein [Pseudomonadota bacterium]